MSIPVEFTEPGEVPAAFDSGDRPSEMSRRSLVKAGVAIGAAALSTPGLLAQGLRPKAPARSETLATTLYNSLSQDQRKTIVFPFDHPLRLKVSNNWSITPANVSTYSGDQQEMIRQIFLGLHSPEHADAVMRQVIDDNGEERGFGASSIAFFGQPGTGKFEFVLTSGHCTRRCDADSTAGTAFGGPIFYGHRKMGPSAGQADHSGNTYWYQAKQANRVFQMLDGKQRTLALLDSDRGEYGTETVRLTGMTVGLPGIPMTELSRDQKTEVRKTLATLLAPFRKADADEALKLVDANGFDHLHMAFFKSGGIGNDQVWNIWQIEGPTMLWYFRGVPHVHSWVNIKRRADA